jgi:hypothetical protein
VVLTLALARFGLEIGRVLRMRKLEAVEGPLAHLAAGVAFLAQAAIFGFVALGGVLDERRGAAAFALVLVGGWAAGVTLGHLGKLLSLSAWSTWPPGPRPKQAALYPRGAWKAEAVAFAVGVELVAAGILAESEGLARVGGGVLLASALLAAAGAAITVRRANAGREAQRDSTASAAR